MEPVTSARGLAGTDSRAGGEAAEKRTDLLKYGRHQPTGPSTRVLIVCIIQASTNPAGCPPSPAAASWKTPSCSWCKSKPPTQTLSTGWAEPPPASSSSPKHRRRPLIYSQTGTLPEFKKSTGRWLKTLHSTTPTKSSHPSASYRTRSSAPCGPPTQVANRQSHWQRWSHAPSPPVSYTHLRAHETRHDLV